MTDTTENAVKCRQALSCWFLTGATASGKSAVSMVLAERLNAEIISMDSMAIYRGMDIGTAKPAAEHQAILPHHLIDIRDPTDAFSVNEYRELALQLIAEIRGRGKEVLFVGGTALYLKALLRGLFDGPPADWEFRKQIEAEVADVGNEALHDRLAQVDPVAAHKLHINDRRRVIRALEVYKLTGKPISHWQMEFSEGRPATDCRVFSIRHPRPILHQRIEDRVEQMFAQGLIEEVQRLLERWTDLGNTASQAVGYREVIEHIRGERNHEETVEKVRVRTRRFARHQETWFRGLSECEMVDIAGEYDAELVADRIFELGKSRQLNEPNLPAS